MSGHFLPYLIRTALFTGVLSRLKIASLDGERKQAKLQYTEHMNSYTTTMFGRPMEKLNVSNPLTY